MSILPCEAIASFAPLGPPGVAHVCLNCLAGAPSRLDQRLGFRSRGCVLLVSEDDVCPLAGQSNGRAATDAPRAAGDDCHLSVKLAHIALCADPCGWVAA